MTMAVLVFIIITRLTGHRLLVWIHTDIRSNSVATNVRTQSIRIVDV